MGIDFGHHAMETGYSNAIDEYPSSDPDVQYEGTLSALQTTVLGRLQWVQSNLDNEVSPHEIGTHKRWLEKGR